MSTRRRGRRASPLAAAAAKWQMARAVPVEARWRRERCACPARKAPVHRAGFGGRGGGRRGRRGGAWRQAQDDD
jgi:hypothetical protein